MEVNSFVTGFAVGKKNAKKPVLTELTVTENGVYDEPMIGGAPDFTVGNTVTFKETPALDDIPADYLPAEGEANKQTMFIETSDSIAIVIAAYGGFAIQCYLGTMGTTYDSYLYMDEAIAPHMGEAFGLTEAGWYLVSESTGKVVPLEEPPTVTINDEATAVGFASVPNIFASPSTPADGWNKVTVNVPTGGLELNIAYGDTPPEDTSKYWIKSKTPQKFIFYKWNQVLSAADIVPSNTSMGTMPYSIHSCVTAVLGDVIYILGGTIFDNNQGRTVESTKVFTFDVNTKKVVELEAQLPTTVSTNNGGEQIGEYVYFFKAEYGVFRYNLVTGQSETIETDYTPGNTCRSTHIGSKIYLVDASTSSKGLDEFDTETNIGRNVGYWSNSTSSARIIAVDDKIYMFGNTFVARYDLITNLSTVVRTGDSNNGNIMLAYLGGREIYCFGKYGTTAVKAFDIYSNQVNSVYLSMTLSGTTMSETGRNNMYLGLAVIGDTIYQFGGRDSGGSSSTDSSRYFADIVKYSIPKGKINSLTRDTMVFSVAERGYMAPIVATEDIQLNVPVDGCYMGDSDGVGRIVDAFVYSNNEKQWELARNRR